MQKSIAVKKATLRYDMSKNSWFFSTYAGTRFSISERKPEYDEEIL